MSKQKFYAKMNEQLSKDIKEGNIKRILIQGEYGVGKTTFAKNLCESMGYRELEFIKNNNHSDNNKEYKIVDCVLRNDDQTFMQQLIENEWNGEKDVIQLEKRKRRHIKKDKLSTHLTFLFGSLITIILGLFTLYAPITDKFRKNHHWLNWNVFSLLLISLIILAMISGIILWLQTRKIMVKKPKILIIDNIDRCEWEFIVKLLSLIETLQDVIVISIFDSERLRMRYNESFGGNSTNIMEEIEKSFKLQINLNDYSKTNIPLLFSENDFIDKRSKNYFLNFLDVLSTNENFNPINYRNINKLHKIYSRNWSAINHMGLNPLHFIVIQYIRLENEYLFRKLEKCSIESLLDGPLSLGNIQDEIRNKKLKKEKIKVEDMEYEVGYKYSKFDLSWAVQRSFSDLNNNFEIFDIFEKENLLFLVNYWRIENDDPKVHEKKINDRLQRYYFYDYDTQREYDEYKEFINAIPTTIFDINNEKKIQWFFKELSDKTLEGKFVSFMNLYIGACYEKINDLGLLHRVLKEIIKNWNDWIEFISFLKNSHYMNEEKFVALLYASFVFNNYFIEVDVQTRNAKSMIYIVKDFLTGKSAQDTFYEVNEHSLSRSKCVFLKDLEVYQEFTNIVLEQLVIDVENFKKTNPFIFELNKIFAKQLKFNYLEKHIENFKMFPKYPNHINATLIMDLYGSEPKLKLFLKKYKMLEVDIFGDVKREISYKELFPQDIRN
ncbi:P-loop NTPase fold protein [Mycoplasma todarodis]|uniref:KAP NTPase domain-containing protein n=1 Tax=Mycoplasma todarodis TaxID=1937191 RepID=A0A4R0XW24_9MOLU|nr:P-loop NTPase fold protein [Mycoplasma todarodis]TCG12095.1 hypothetical protein C4B25_00170 [Mycoplasma todarodis]